MWHKSRFGKKYWERGGKEKVGRGHEVNCCKEKSKKVK